MEKCSTMENERILEKIEELMAQHEYTKYKLAKLSGIKKIHDHHHIYEEKHGERVQSVQDV